MAISPRHHIRWIVLLGIGGHAIAAENLPPLRIDPALLGARPQARQEVPAVRAEQPRAAAPAQAAAQPSAAAAPAPVSVDAIRRDEPAPAIAAPAATLPVAESASEAGQPRAGGAAVPGAASAGVPGSPRQETSRAAAMAPEKAAASPAAPVPGASAAGRPATAAPGQSSDAPGQPGQVPAAALAGEPPKVGEPPVVAPLYSAHVAAGLIPDATLRLTRRLPADRSQGSDEPGPTFVVADDIRGINDREVVATGAVELRKLGTSLEADRLTYWQQEDEVDAVGNVRLTRDQDQMSGPRLRMKMEESTGFFESPAYSITRSSKAVQATGPVLPGSSDVAPTQGQYRPPITGYGSAERIDFEGENQFRLTRATYSTCGPGSDPAWYADVGEMRLDYDAERGEANDATVRFKGFPIFYAPWMSFSLNNQRKSGFLAPTFGSTSKSGLEFTVPFYWNIAPNMDATIAPRLLSRRGAQWNTELRYLDHGYFGQARFEYLPNDHLANRRRSGYSISHTHSNLGDGFSGSLDLNGVSDDTYFSDLSTRVSTVSQGNLLRKGQLNYSGSWWSASLTSQSYQTLQDPASGTLIPTPYKRLPQFTLRAARPDLPYGAVATFGGEFVNFGHPTQVLGRRTTLYPQVAMPIEWTAFSLTPKIGLHSTSYSLERQGAGVPDRITRNVPIASLDGTVVFERETELFGRRLNQTLEPRLYYLYVPKRDQNQIPNFDTAIADINFAQIFSENRYSGGDRIADANQLTAAVTSRLVDPDSGAELLRGTLGQVHYFTTQHVTLRRADGTLETPRTSRAADLLAALSGQVARGVWFDTGWQYNPRDGRTERINMGGRYQPEPGKVLNAGYRYSRDSLGQIDLSGQWPVGGGWYGVGRYNYSTKDHRIIESVGGLEFDGGCWVGRFVVQRLATLANRASTAVFVQLELNGFSRIGSNPLEILKRNIPGYGRINQPTADPVFASD